MSDKVNKENIYIGGDTEQVGAIPKIWTFDGCVFELPVGTKLIVDNTPAVFNRCTIRYYLPGEETFLRSVKLHTKEEYLKEAKYYEKE